MFARHRSNLLELELGDWKQARRFRLMAVLKKDYNSEVAFTDLTYEYANKPIDVFNLSLYVGPESQSQPW